MTPMIQRDEMIAAIRKGRLYSTRSVQKFMEELGRLPSEIPLFKVQNKVDTIINKFNMTRQHSQFIQLMYSIIHKMVLEKKCGMESTDYNTKDYPLHKAVENNDLTTLLFLLKTKGMKPDSLNSKEETPLFVAAKNLNFQCAYVLLEYGANIQPSIASPLLIAAIEDKNIEIVKLLLEKNVPTTGKDSLHHGHPPIYFAAKNGFLEAFKLLMREDPIENQGLLHVAAKNGQTAMIRYLLSKGINCNTQDNEGNTLLHHAVETHIDLVNDLLGLGLDVNAVNHLGHTPLHYLMFNRHQSSFEIFKALLNHGASLNIQSKEGETPLHILTMSRSKNEKKIIESSLQQDQNLLHMQDNSGNTVLHIVLRNLQRDFERWTDIALYLLNQGAKIDIKNVVGETPSDALLKSTEVLGEFISYLKKRNDEKVRRNRHSIF